MAAKNKNSVELYQKEFGSYSILAGKMKILLDSIFEDCGIEIHIIESRAKSVDSFREKINRSGKNYIDPINQINDLCGCRVIVHYADDVEKIGDIIKSEFDIVEEEISHKMAELDVDRFGYLSAHYVVKINQKRLNWRKWASHSGQKIEIQVRTVIQHAWSAVSYALQYKQETGIPSSLQRRLNRIAGLFELADEEFVGIRDQRASLKIKVQAALAQGDLDIGLTSSSIIEAVQSWSYRAEVRDFAKTVGFVTEGSPGFRDDDPTETITDIYDLSRLAKIGTIRELLETINPPRLEFLREAYSRRAKGRTWRAPDEFLFFFVLLDKKINLVNRGFMADHDWDNEYTNWLLGSQKA